ncbi:MAG: hypothetical protein ACT4NL_08135 [Pseudomarimonas sp.]
MKSIALATCIFSAALLSAPVPADACGASLFGVGQNSRFRSYKAPRPANVVVYVDAALSDRQLGNPADFERALERSGHQVTLAHNQPELSAALSNGKIDIVVADLSVMDSVANDAQQLGSGAAMLPIVADLEASLLTSIDGYQRSLAPDADLRETLRAINDLMKLRLRG